jgi:hypothetical protein
LSGGIFKRGILSGDILSGDILSRDILPWNHMYICRVVFALSRHRCFCDKKFQLFPRKDFAPFCESNFFPAKPRHHILSIQCFLFPDTLSIYFCFSLSISFFCLHFHILTFFRCLVHWHQQKSSKTKRLVILLINNLFIFLCFMFLCHWKKTWRVCVFQKNIQM